MLELDDDPGGLGWLPDGDLLVVGMEQRKLWRWDGTELTLHADLAPFAAWPCNDMTVAADGTAYVTQFGFDSWHGTTGRLASAIIAVTPDGAVSVAADELICPNGIAFDADERLVFVAEPAAMRITRFARGGRRHARRPGRVRHASPRPRARPTPRPTASASTPRAGSGPPTRSAARSCTSTATARCSRSSTTPQHALACTLGGDDGRTLFVCSAGEHHKPTRSGVATGRVDAYRVEVPGSRRLP